MDYIIAFISVLLLTAAGGPVFIPLLRKLKFGQTVRDDGPSTHLIKMGTPTMGGIIFLIPIILVSLVNAYLAYPEILPVLFLTVGFSAVGFIDDYIKVTKKCKDGLKPRQKMLGLVFVSVIFASIVFWFTNVGTEIFIPFTGMNVKFDLAWMYIPFISFTAICMANAVNLTDGLDGLVSGITGLIAAVLAIIALKMGQWTGIGLNAVIIAGGCLGFLIFNFHPAKVFMGDVGSLALGGALTGIAVMMGNPLILIITGIIFIAETLSVAIQVMFFKRTGRRVFKMAPLHHHFELSGWKETKVVFIFWILAALSCAIAWISVFGIGG